MLIGHLNAVSPSQGAPALNSQSFVDSSVSRSLLRPEEETVAAIMDIVRQRGGGAPHQNWEPLLRTKPDTNPLTSRQCQQ